MLEFTEWMKELKKRKDEDDILDARLQYRMIQIIGGRQKAPARSRLTEEEERKIDNDPEIIKLRYQKSIVQKEIIYIEDMGELPPERNESEWA